MSENERDPKVFGVDSTVTISGQVTDVPGEVEAENAAKQYLWDEFHNSDEEGSSIGLVDIVVSQVSTSDMYKFIATFKLEQGELSEVSL